jgi:hypothetical protein
MKIFNGGYLGSHNDEERSEMRYVMRIAEFRESSNLWTQPALDGYPFSMFVSVCLVYITKLNAIEGLMSFSR